MWLDNMRKIAVIFPGVGYNQDRPLLYYSGKVAMNSGFDVERIVFSKLEWSKEKLKDQAFLLQMLDKCLHTTGETLKNIGDMSGDEVIFISKSIGTVVAAAYAHEKNLNVKHICFSPLETIGEYIKEESGILFYGDNDPYADYIPIEKIAREKKLETYRVSGGNHSLETGDVLTDIENIKDIMMRITTAMPR